MAEKEIKKYKVKEKNEGLQTRFGEGLKKDKNGKVQYLRQVKNEDGSIDKNKTKVFVSLYIGTSSDKELPNFQDYAVSLTNAERFKKAGVNLAEKFKTPIKIRFTAVDYYSEEHGNRTLRELFNVAVRKDDSWEWIVPKKSEEPAEEVEVSEDDLPF